jgi:hypothetical protein
MSTDREANFPIENFIGVDVQTEREKKSPYHFRRLQNLWEPKLGSLEPRRGSEESFDLSQLPSNVIGIDNPYKLYRSTGENVRVLPIYCDDSTDFVAGTTTLNGARVYPFADIPSYFSFLFQNSVFGASGSWLSTNFGSGGLDDGTYTLSTKDCILRIIGYGFDKLYHLDLSQITGYVTPGLNVDKVLRITQLTTPDVPDNVIGWELYQRTEDRFLFVGANDLFHRDENGIIPFRQGENTTYLYSPVMEATGTPAGVGSTEIAFSAKVVKNGAGRLKKGTYYVTVTSQELNMTTSPVRNAWTQTAQDFNNVIPIVVDEDYSAIVVNVPGAAQRSPLLTWIGNHWQCLTPAKVVYETDGGGPSWELNRPLTVSPINHYDLETQTGGNIWIKDTMISPAAVLGIYAGTTQWRYNFIASDFSTKDMAVELVDNPELVFVQGIQDLYPRPKIRPIFMSRLTADVQIPDQPLWQPSNSRSFLDNRFEARYQGPTLDIHQQAGIQSRYNFAQTDDIMFIANDFDPNTITGLTSNDNAITFDFDSDVPDNRTNLMVSDGRVMAKIALSPQNSGGDRVHLPAVKYVDIFEDSLVVGGGFRSTDPSSGAMRDGSRSVFYSRTSDLFDFTEAGAAANTLNQFFVRGPEEVTGLGVYSNTSGDAGPITQLIVGKQSSSWLTTSLSGGSLTNLSRKAGIVSHQSIVNTPIGTIFAATDNVYLMRQSGEPTPIGSEISVILSRSDLTRAVAVYHDQQYKLAFYDPNEGGNPDYNNVEYWLDIRKMKILQGQASWKGPMIGRIPDYSLVEDYAPDGISYDVARDRLMVDKQNRLIINADTVSLDSDDEITDLGVQVECEIETADFTIAQQDNNWNKLITRFYLKAKTNAKKVVIEEETWTDGVLRETKDINIFKATDNGFEEQPFITRSFFPKTRIRGRTLRKVLRFSARAAIAGFALLYRIERRRI